MHLPLFAEKKARVSCAHAEHTRHLSIGIECGQLRTHKTGKVVSLQVLSFICPRRVKPVDVSVTVPLFLNKSFH